MRGVDLIEVSTSGLLVSYVVVSGKALLYGSTLVDEDSHRVVVKVTQSGTIDSRSLYLYFVGELHGRLCLIGGGRGNRTRVRAVVSVSCTC